MDIIQLALVTCVVGYTLAAAICDTRTAKLPNVLTVPALALGFLFHLGRGAWLDDMSALDGALFSLGGFAIGFGLLLVMWLIGSGGGGDVKFMGALGAWLGFELTLMVFLVSAVLMGIGTIAILTWEFTRVGPGRVKERYLKTNAPPQAKAGAKKKAPAPAHRRLMPYGVPAALATWAVLAVAVMASKI